jgi:hypothetical protein
MSVSYYAHVVVGIKVKKDAFYSEKEVPGCAHSNISSGAKFCPECGAPATKIESEPIDGYDDCRSSYRGLSLVDFGYENDEVVLGRAIVKLGRYSDSWIENFDLQRLEAARQEIMDQLEGSPFKEDPKVWLCVSMS